MIDPISVSFKCSEVLANSSDHMRNYYVSLFLLINGEISVANFEIAIV